MVDKLKHYSFTSPASVYDEEAMTALELSGSIGAKLNELITCFNQLDTETKKKVEGIISSMQTMIDVALEGKIVGGVFDDQINAYLGDLEARLDACLNASDGGSIEVADIRVAYDGTSYANAGEATREQAKHAGIIGDLLAAAKPTFYNLQKHPAESIGKYFILDDGSLYVGIGDYAFPFIPADTITTDVYVVLKGWNGAGKIKYGIVTEAGELTVSEADFEHYKLGTLDVFKLDKSIPEKYKGQRVRIKYDNRGSKEALKVEKTVICSNLYAALRVINQTDTDATINGSQIGERVSFFATGYAHGAFDVYDGFVYTLDTSTTLASAMKHTTVRPYDLKAGDKVRFNGRFKWLMWSLNDKTHTAYSDSWMNAEDVVTVNKDDRVLITFDGASGYQDVGEVTADIIRYQGATGGGSGGGICYVSPDGDDSGDGSKATPYKTIQKAVHSGAETIYVAPGEYHESICNDTPRNALNILAQRPDYDETLVRSPAVVINGGTDITPTSEDAYDQNGVTVYRIPYASVSSDLIYKVFVSKSVAISETDRSIGYPVTVWRRYAKEPDIASGDTYNHVTHHVRLTPVSTVSALETTANSFTYDGTYIYIRVSSTLIGDYEYILDDGKIPYGLDIRNVAHVHLDNIVTRYTNYDGIKLTNCNDVELYDCEASFSALGNGIKLENSSGDLHNCYAYYNRNDGINLHYAGMTSLHNCRCCYNFDDGVSHHDHCTGAIYGGEYCNNGKAGIASPTYGARVSIYNANISENAQYGILAYSDVWTQGDMMYIYNAFISGCPVGIKAENYAVNTVHCGFMSVPTEMDGVAISGYATWYVE